ncbi:glycosyltransferase family 2 protein [Actinomadura scrupuli]|uniref:glycosyltransferase family 2 protein n=1 Tax=Actinomadura scrupuli TaxID=559629 RepID=UPI003D95AF00
MIASVVTATYNRAATLPALSASIETQGIDLEWVVVDDGSTDETPEVMAGLAARAPFPVRYLRRPHRGKHVALNHGIPVAHGEMLALIDSDDELLPGGLARLLDHWHRIPAARREQFVGVTGRGIDDTGQVIGNAFPGPVPVECRWHDAVYVHRASGDRCGILRADVLREHPFPEPDHRWFVLEGTVWRQIGRRYLTRYVDDPVLAVHTAGADRISRRPFTEIAAAVREYYALVISQDLRWFRHAPACFLGSAVQYARASLHERVPLSEQAAELPVLSRALWAGALPLGAALWLLDQRRPG